MQQMKIIIFMLMQIVLLQWTFAEKSAYCYRNVTETAYKTVTKTRLKTVPSKNILKKMIFKKDTQIEIYVDDEPVYTFHVERICCDGYKLDKYDLCEPQCDNGCPLHSKCVEPDVCECKSSYFSVRSAVNGKHICEPICREPCPEHSECVGANQCACKKGYHNKHQMCEPYCASGCPHGGICVAPNTCSCQERYKSEKGTCLPTCSLGNQCENGRCIDLDFCICNHGFIKNYETYMCEPDNLQRSTHYYDITELTTFTSITTDLETSNDDFDLNQLFEEISEITTEGKINCPQDFIFHKGQCRPLKFISNEFNCWQKPCVDKHAFCLENGTCACSEGFKLYESHVGIDGTLNETTKTVCISTDLEENPHENATQESFHWISIFFAVFGILIIVSALIFLGMKIFLRQTGEIDVEGKNLSCSYNHRACSDMEKSII